MTLSRRILKGGEIPAGVVSWNAPEVTAAEPVPVAEPDAPQPQNPAEIIEHARQQGYEQGRSEGIAAGMADVQQHAVLLQQILANLAQPLVDMDEQFEQEVLELVKAVSRQLIGRELQADSSNVLDVIRAGLSALPMSARNVQVRLHPQDAEVVRELLKADEANRSWVIEADPQIPQGGCRIVTEAAQIDGSIETRLNQLIAKMLEDERAPAE